MQIARDCNRISESIFDTQRLVCGRLGCSCGLHTTRPCKYFYHADSIIISLCTTTRSTSLSIRSWNRTTHLDETRNGRRYQSTNIFVTMYPMCVLRWIGPTVGHWIFGICLLVVLLYLYQWWIGQLMLSFYIIVHT